MRLTEEQRTIAGVLAGGLAVLALVAGLQVLTKKMRGPEKAGQPQSDRARVQVRSTVEGAEIVVDGQRCGVGSCALDLRRMTHQAEAHKPGHEDAIESFEAVPGAVVELSPRPLLATVVLRADLDGGSVRLDGKAAGALIGGTLELPDLAAGVHRVELSSGAFQAEVEVECQPGAAPRLTKPPMANGMRLTAIAAAGPQARLYTTARDAELSMGMIALGLVGAEGAPLPPLDRGAHQLSIKPAKGTAFDIVYETSNAPSLLALISANRGLGSLRVSTGDDEATVYLNDEAQKRKPKNGRVLLLVPPKTYRIRVERAGFVAPPPREVKVAAGSEVAVEMRLQPAPTRASLRITDAPAGATVSMDGQAAGNAGSDGSLTIGGERPGRRVVEARQEGYLPGRWEVNLEAGKTAQLRAALARAPGTLRIELQPAGTAATLRIRRKGQFEDRALEGLRHTLPEGEYTVSASTAGGVPVSQPVRVKAGAEAAVTLRVGPAPAPAAAEAAPRKEDLLEAWVSSSGWKRNGDAVTKAGGGITLAPVSASARSIEFTAQLRKGRRLRWVTGYRDASNYTLYEYGDSSLERIAVANGARTPANSAAHSGGRKGPIRIRIEERDGAVATSALIDGQWVNLDSAPSANGLRRFGFHIPGSDEVGLIEFHAISSR